MKLLLDTSVFVAALVEQHPMHTVVLPWLQRVQNGTDDGFMAAHSLAEIYSILTRLPIKPTISSASALDLIRRNIIDTFQLVALSDADYIAIIEQLASIGITGGAVYDALPLHAADIAGVDQIVTFNERDFRRVYPQLAHKIVVPR